MTTHRQFTGWFILATAPGLFAHGLIQSPPSRSWICGAETRPDEIEFGTPATPQCSTAFAVDELAAYNYMAVLTHSLGRAEESPLPQNVCSFDSESWNGGPTPWDVPMAWPTTPMSAGEQTFVWNISWGPHFDDTFEFRYWITKPEFQFSPTAALTWEDFETAAFCVLEYDASKPQANPGIVADKANSLFTTHCQVPERNGHHVIYAEWGRTPPTYERFHGCVDVGFLPVAVRPVRSGSRGGTRIPEFTDVLGRSRETGKSILFPNP